MRVTRAGFTGTKGGLRPAAAEKLTKVQASLLEVGLLEEWHHGDCVGADEDSHVSLVRLDLPVTIYIHPPEDRSRRAFCNMMVASSRIAVVVQPERPYLVRNDNIVVATEILIACPSGYDELKRGSGTWHAIRCAERRKKEVVFIYPDGRLTSGRYRGK